ncbi:MAG: hypothetical protein COS84_08370 [Armatimonadetes bacterium CG07_land_8_20_14_0_80_40_9]|nr:MAG: hypothetical protein COS84_08370 [Armatimonadetes bacterium CG07_land_8_20_14_0_80_40_9]
MITLLTDFGLEDSFVGTLKGVIYRINPDVKCKINKISKSYLENKPGELLAVWGSFGFLEISQREGNAKKRLKIKGAGERVVVDVKGHSSR